jgi:hypothetical protein
MGSWGVLLVYQVRECSEGAVETCAVGARGMAGGSFLPSSKNRR